HAMAARSRGDVVSRLPSSQPMSRCVMGFTAQTLTPPALKRVYLSRRGRRVVVYALRGLRLHQRPEKRSRLFLCAGEPGHRGADAIGPFFLRGEGDAVRLYRLLLGDRRGLPP